MNVHPLTEHYIACADMDLRFTEEEIIARKGMIKPRKGSFRGWKR